MIGTGLASMLLFVWQAPPRPDAASIQIVRDFLALADSSSQSAAGMLAPDAVMVAGDAGAPMTAEHVRTTFAELSRRCRQNGESAAPYSPPMPGRSLSQVVLNYRCAAEGGAPPRNLEIHFVVEGNRIAGMFIPTGRPPLSH